MRIVVAACVLAWVAAAGSAAAAGAADTPPPAEVFFQRPALLQAKLSPSGRQVALTTSRGGTRVSLVVLDLAPKIEPRAVATFTDADVADFHWLGSDRLVFSVTDLESGSGEDRRAAPGLYAVDAAGGPVRQLVRRRGLPAVSDGTPSVGLDWNHALLHVPSAHAGASQDEVLVGEMVFGERQLRSVRPLWLNTRSGRTRSLTGLDAPPNTIHWLFDGQGRPRLAQAQADGRRIVYWRGEGDSAWRVLSDEPLLRQRFAAHSVDDDGTLWVTQPMGEAGTEVLTRFDFANGRPAAPPLVVTPGFDFHGSLLRDENGRSIGVRMHTDAEGSVWFGDAMKRAQARIDEALPGRVNRVDCRRCGARDMVALVRSYADRDPGRLLLYDAANDRWQRLTTLLDGVDPRQMAAVDFQRIRARDGRELPLWLTLPTGVAPGRPAPAVVLVHGGPWSRGGYWRWEAMAQFLASRGYLVINPEFRGSDGYGAAHLHAGFRQWGRAMQDDVADALRWARDKGLADRERACIAGASYGGYSALMGLVRDGDLYRCGIAWVAITDPFLLLEGSWWVDDDASDASRRYTLPEMIGDPKADAAMLTAASPLAQAARIRAPLLLAVGDKDRRAPPAHARRLRDALQAEGRAPEWVSYDDEGHTWRKTATNVDFARRVERFLQQHLRGDAAR